MYECSNKLVKYKEYSCFDHSDSPAHSMYAEVAWVIASLRTQFQSQIILDLDYLPDYLSISYNYGFK